MKIGYARVSGPDQSLDVQLQQLKKAGCEHIYREKQTAKNTERPGLQNLLKHLRPLDVLVVCKLDRLARNTADLLDLLKQIGDAGAKFVSLAEPWADTSSPAGTLIITVLAGIAQFERQRLHERAAEGRALAKSRGQSIGGRKPVLNSFRQKAALEMYAVGDVSAREVARTFGIHVATFNRLRQRAALTAGGTE